MKYSMQSDEDLRESQSDEEIRRQLGWYLVLGNCNTLNHDIDTMDQFILNGSKDAN